MKRHNGQSLEIRATSPSHAPEFLGRQTCHECHVLVPRGSDRPFCLAHSAYAQRLRAELALRQVTVAAPIRRAA